MFTYTKTNVYISKKLVCIVIKVHDIQLQFVETTEDEASPMLVRPIKAAKILEELSSVHAYKFNNLQKSLLKKQSQNAMIVVDLFAYFLFIG